MVYELERVLRVCNGFLCSMSVTYDDMDELCIHMMIWMSYVDSSTLQIQKV